MTHVRTSRLTALAVVGALTLTACGLKPGVEVRGGTGGAQALAGSAGGDTGGTTGDTGALTSPGPQATNGATAGAGGGGTANQPQAGGESQPGASGPTNTGGGTTGGGGESSGGGGESTGGGGSPQFQVSGSDRTGVTDEAITVAFHAPVTGAAPLPAEAFERARDLYWRYYAEQGRNFLGREEVEVLFQDDTYDPAAARQICRQLAAEAFIVAGGGGTDQIQSCGQLAGAEQFPYFSAGVTEAGLDENPWYFAASMTYRQQGLLLAQYIKQEFPNQKFSAILTRTPNFDDALNGFIAGVEQVGIGDNFVEPLRNPKDEKTWFNTFAQRMDNEGVEVIYMLMAPVDYLDFAKQAVQNGYGPFTYVGVGVSMGLNAVLANGCDPDQVHDARFFSPFPGLDWARDNVPEYFDAWDDFDIDARKRPGDMDLGFALWAINKQLDLLFQRYEQTFGTDLTREDFRALVEGGGPLESGIFPAVSYSPDNHFGGQSVHVLRANCDLSPPEYVTDATFATGF